MQYGLCHLYKCVICTLRHTVLLWNIRDQSLVLNTMGFYKNLKCLWCVFTTIVWSQRLHHVLRFIFHKSVLCFKPLKHISHALSTNTHIFLEKSSIKVKKIPCIVAHRNSLYRNTHIKIHNIQYLSCRCSFIIWKWSPCLLDFNTSPTHNMT